MDVGVSCSPADLAGLFDVRLIRFGWRLPRQGRGGAAGVEQVVFAGNQRYVYGNIARWMMRRINMVPALLAAANACADHEEGEYGSGGPGGARTHDQRIMSPLL